MKFGFDESGFINHLPASGHQSPKVRSLEAAMAVLGPEDCATIVEFTTALKNAKGQASVRQDGSRHQDGRSPRACFQVGEGFDRLGDFDGVEVESLRAALKRAQKEQEVSVAV